MRIVVWRAGQAGFIVAPSMTTPAVEAPIDFVSVQSVPLICVIRVILTFYAAKPRTAIERAPSEGPSAVLCGFLRALR
jgi:hypothetical protein